MLRTYIVYVAVFRASNVMPESINVHSANSGDINAIPNLHNREPLKMKLVI